MNKSRIEKILGMELSKMKKDDVISMTVEEAYNINDKLLYFGFWAGFGVVAFPIILTLIYFYYFGFV